MKLLQKILGTKKRFAYEGPNAELVHAMHEMALSDNEETRKRLYQALLASTLTIPTPELPEAFRTPGIEQAGDNTRVDIVVLHNKDGQKVTTAFTDIEALRAWDPNTPSISLKSQALFQMVMGSDIQQVMINPFDPIRRMIRPGGFVTRVEMDLLVKSLVPTRLGRRGVEFQLRPDQELFIGVPASRPSPEVEEGLRIVAVESPEIAGLYLFQMATSEGTSQKVIGIQIDKLVPREHEGKLAAKLGEAIQPRLEEGQSLDFLILRGKFGEDVRSRGVLIFRRP